MLKTLDAAQCRLLELENQLDECRTVLAEMKAERPAWNSYADINAMRSYINSLNCKVEGLRSELSTHLSFKQKYNDELYDYDLQYFN